MNDIVFQWTTHAVIVVIEVWDMRWVTRIVALYLTVSIVYSMRSLWAHMDGTPSVCVCVWAIGWLVGWVAGWPEGVDKERSQFKMTLRINEKRVCQWIGFPAQGKSFVNCYRSHESEGYWKLNVPLSDWTKRGQRQTVWSLWEVEGLRGSFLKNSVIYLISVGLDSARDDLSLGLRLQSIPETQIILLRCLILDFGPSLYFSQ